MESRKPSVPRVFTVVMGALLCLSFALLIWAKLRMLQGVPRTAYAVPETSQAQKPQLSPQPRPEELPQRSVEATQQDMLGQSAHEQSTSSVDH